MNLAKQIYQTVAQMPDRVQAEVLHFAQFLDARRAEFPKETSWSAFSISSAMRGMEEEGNLYRSSDVKEKF